MSQLKNAIFLNFFLTLDFFRVYLWAKNFNTIQNLTGAGGRKNYIKLKKDLHYRSSCDILAAPTGSGVKVIP